MSLAMARHCTAKRSVRTSVSWVTRKPPEGPEVTRWGESVERLLCSAAATRALDGISVVHKGVSCGVNDNNCLCSNDLILCHNTTSLRSQLSLSINAVYKSSTEVTS